MFSSQVIVHMILSVHTLTQGQPWCSIGGQIWGCPQNFTLCSGSTSGAGDVRGSPKSILNFMLYSRPCLSPSFSLLPIHPIHLCCEWHNIGTAWRSSWKGALTASCKSWRDPQCCDCSTPSSKAPCPAATPCTHPWVHTAPSEIS